MSIPTWKVIAKPVRLIEDTQEDLVLEFCTTVLGLKSLHWGFWKKGEELNLEHLRKAQARFSHVLKEYIPKNAKTILDVGCGIGDNAQVLAKEGYALTCISPDLNHKKVFDRIKNRNITFHQERIERFLTKKQFDVLLMSESAHYFDKEVAFTKFRRIIRDRGFIVVAGLFRKSSTKAYAYFPVEQSWIATAQRHGFSVKKRKDITRRVLPTSQLGGELLENNLKPGVNIIERYMKRRSPLQYALLKGIFRKQIRELESYFRIGPIPEMFNPELFQAKARYVIYVLQKNEKGAEAVS